MNDYKQCDCGSVYKNNISERQKHSHSKQHRLYLQIIKLENKRLEVMDNLARNFDVNLKNQLDIINKLIIENEKEFNLILKK